MGKCLYIYKYLCFVIDLASTLLVIHYSQIFLGWEHMLHMGIWCTLHILNLRLFMFHPMSHDNFTISPPIALYRWP
jgi:hypothetical protein